MKNQIKSLFLVILFAGISNAVWGQASTQGKEFWVSSSIVCSPAKGEGIDPYLAVSASVYGNYHWWRRKCHQHYLASWRRFMDRVQ